MELKGWPEGSVFAAGDDLEKDPPVVEIEDDTDPDDEELEVTPPDVVMLLGFDPKEFSEGPEKE